MLRNYREDLGKLTVRTSSPATDIRLLRHRPRGGRPLGLAAGHCRNRPPMPLPRVILIGLLAAGSARAADVEAGKKVFDRCKICHAVEAGRQTALGPNLHGPFGRKAGSLPGYAYSAAIKDSGITWDDDSPSQPEGLPARHQDGFPGHRERGGSEKPARLPERGDEIAGRTAWPRQS